MYKYIIYIENGMSSGEALKEKARLRREKLREAR